MVIQTYNIELIMSDSSKAFWLGYLTQIQCAYNDCAKYLFNNKITLNITKVHNEVYGWLREKYNTLPAQAIIKIYKDAMSALRSVKSNKHKIEEAPIRKNLACRLDKNLYNNLSVDGISLSGEQKNKRTFYTFKMYDKAEEMFKQYIPKDPLIFMRGDRIFLSVPFEVNEKPCLGVNAIGVDMGLKRLYVTSEGKYYKDKNYLCRRRKVRFLKRTLKYVGTISAKRHIKKLSHKEHNISKSMCEHAVNTLLKSTNADIIVLEDLSKIKQNTSRFESGMLRKRHNNRMSQVPFHKFKEVLTYKAQLVGKRVETVSPHNTSRLDSRTNTKDGIRQGCRYYCSDGVVLDADWNAAINICKRFKHRPTSSNTATDGCLTPLVGRHQSTCHMQ